ncbi:tetratricopeptide repeat protein [Dysgonomonas sp. Marseille-P4677]|uniref:tetratricopeptide repeat protein n=1 Tax=Dysgonomonas sp. Marseille-P4677 TaxID=2364790 RepID=UPI0019114A4F|nr:tetratricopeptide repeat protein [Dysgonomonas sp. Marseille-P4677]MBK5721600.1 tetratricopeptide repeat protein [Dysgonomonas sp. Marseille-P4677]
MKRIILSCLFIFSIYTIANAQDSTSIVSDSLATVKADTEEESSDPAIKAYNEGDFREAIEILEKEKKEQLEKGVESAQLYYNLGNAYFRVNDLAHARLNYEKSLLLDPGDRDTRHNIEYLLTKIEDKILVADTFFLSTWFRAVQNLFASNTWAVISVVFFLLLIACLASFFFTRRIFVKKAAFYTGIVALLVVIFANVFSFGQRNKIEHRDTAVIMVGSASVVSSPDINSKELFILHSGTKVYITKEDRSWLEIEVDNGSVGWIQREKIEII